MILNDKPNCQVSKILMNPRPILSDSSENDPLPTFFYRLKIKFCMTKKTAGELKNTHFMGPQKWKEPSFINKLLKTSILSYEICEFINSW
jgi:hypothetical protein